MEASGYNSADAPSSTSARSKRSTVPAERVEAAERHKADGNSKFQAGEIKAAKKEYDEALRNLGKATLSPSTFGIALSTPDECAAASIEEAGPELAARAKACRIPTQLNLALCCLNSEPCEASRALELCESVLDEEPENPKAIYRKAKALIELDTLDEAEWELTRAYKLLPKDVNVRQDLQKLRQRLRDQKVNEKRTYKGVFEKGAGFLSDGREAEAAAADAAAQATKDSQKGFSYTPMKKLEENPYVSSSNPDEDASRLQESGKIEEAIWALEAALERHKNDGSTEARCSTWLELGRLYMDLNIDSLGLTCIAEAVGSQEGTTRQHALLLSAICLLNEAESDPDREVCQALIAWLMLARPESGSDEAPTAANLDDQLKEWRDRGGGGADAAVAHGLLHLVRGRSDEALKDFTALVQAADDDSSFFGSARRRGNKCNMLGAVLANRTRHQAALIAYDWAVRLQPYYPRALFNQGIALQAANKPPLAAASFARVLAMSPSWCADMVWQPLQKACDDADAAKYPELAEAGRTKNFTKVCSLLGQLMNTFSGEPNGSLQDMLDQIAALQD